MRKVLCGMWFVALTGACSTTPAHYVGVVSLSQGPSSTGTGTSGLASASFSSKAELVAVSTDGPCALLDAAQTNGFSAGEIGITGTIASIALLPSGKAPNVMYSGDSTTVPLFSDGAALQVVASGGPEVDAFAVSITAPTTLAGFTPPTSLSRSGYTATWTAGTGPSIRLDIVPSSTVQGSAAALECVVGDTGSFTVPASSFALIPTDWSQVAIEIARIDSRTMPAGNVSVTTSLAIYVDGGPFTLGP
jgi:hypothetical protein